MKSCFLTLDEGTTGITASLYDLNAVKLASFSLDFPQYFPQSGWVEHDLDEIYATNLKVIQRVLEQVPSVNIEGLGITNQRETVCFWDHVDIVPLSRAIVWQDSRTIGLCNDLKKDVGLSKQIHQKTGLVIDPYFSASKIQWGLESLPAVQKALKQGTLSMGTLDSYLVAKLTQSGKGVTEPSNASRTLLFDLHTLDYDSDLLKLFGVSRSCLPEVLPSFGIFGATKGVPGIKEGVPIYGILGDQQAALLGGGCLEPGVAKCTYGTGSFLLLNSGFKTVYSNEGLLTTVAWKNAQNEVVYGLEGSAFDCGSAVEWYFQQCTGAASFKELEDLASTVSSSGGVQFYPFFSGIGAPFWRPHVKGAFLGLSRFATKAHLAFAVFEGLAFQNALLFEAMHKDFHQNLTSIRVDGGASQNNLLMQLQADVTGIELVRPKDIETTSKGALFAAFLGSKHWSMKDVVSHIDVDKVFKPQSDLSLKQFELWKQNIPQ